MNAKAEIHSFYKDVRITVSKDDRPGYYRFWFQIAGQTFHGKAETNLPGVAIRRAQYSVDRQLREAGGSA